MKGISPLVATVLLIAFTVGVGGLISIWVTGFTQTSTSTVSKSGQTQIICSNGAISLTSLKYCNNNISGIIKNDGRITLGNMTLQTIFNNGTTISHALNDTDVGGTSSGNFLALKPGQVFGFNVSIGASSASNYNTIFIYTNCSSVTDTAVSADVTSC